MRKRMWRTCLVGVLAAAGCSDGGYLLLGKAEPSPDMVDAGAEGGEPTADGGEAPDVPELRRCEGGLKELAVEFRIDIVEPTCTGSCRVYPQRLRSGVDGSIWLLASMDEPLGRDRLWLGHYDAKGTPEGSVNLTNYRHQVGELAVDDHGQAWLLHQGSEVQNITTLRRFDASARELEAQLLIGAYTDVVAYPGVGVLLAGRLDPRVVTALDFDGNELWSREDPRGTGRIAVNDVGHFVVASLEPSDPSGPGSTSSLVIDWFDRPEHQPLATTHAQLALELYTSWIGWQSFLSMKLDDAGQLTFAGTASSPLDEYPFTPRTAVERLDIEQGILWRWLIDAQPDAPATFDKASGTTLVGALIGTRAGLVAISDDGQRCQRFGFDGTDLILDLESSPGGEVWFTGLGGSRAGQSDLIVFGRLARPDF